MTEDDRPYAVLAPPVLERFREVTGIGGAVLESRFDGWSKLALLTDDVAYLLPRRGRDEHLRFDADVSAVLNERGVTCVPSVVGRWEDFGEHAGPCVGFERRHGRQWSDIEEDVSLADVTTMLASLGRTIATWHGLDLSTLPERLRRPPAFDPKPTLSAILGPGYPEIVDEAARRAGVSEAVHATWLERVEQVVAINHVFVHGDVCENQLLVDDHHEVHTVIDWDTAGIGHPLHDFDFGEWGFGIYRWESHFAELRAGMWTAYVGERRTPGMPDSDAMNLVFALADFTYFARHRDHGTLDPWRAQRLANTETALAAAT